MRSRKTGNLFYSCPNIRLTPCSVYNRYMIGMWWMMNIYLWGNKRSLYLQQDPPCSCCSRKWDCDNKVTTKSSHCSVLLRYILHTIPFCYEHPRFPGEQHQVAFPLYSDEMALALCCYPHPSLLLPLQRSGNLQIHFLYITGAVSPSLVSHR